jgi:hypothetical protein
MNDFDCYFLALSWGFKRTRKAITPSGNFSNVVSKKDNNDFHCSYSNGHDSLRHGVKSRRDWSWPGPEWKGIE